jgi:hypothetical protein
MKKKRKKPVLPYIVSSVLFFTISPFSFYSVGWLSLMHRPDFLCVFCFLHCFDCWASATELLEAVKRVFTWKRGIFRVIMRMFAVFKSIHFQFDMAYMQKILSACFKCFFLECLPSLGVKIQSISTFLWWFSIKEVSPSNRIFQSQLLSF